MPNLSQEDGRRFIAEVAEDNGGITVEDREFLAAHRPSALRALQKTRRQLADSIRIVVDNLYSKETRFLYELIQNAEDNSYSTATAHGEQPFLAFKVYPDRIIADSNEDGFSEDNIRAICSVATSTKKHSAGYIGEKGIGFKSVFKIARKVHIQSGPFSFAFSHTQVDDDDGLGMITPYYEEAEDLPVGVQTRMTLTLLDSTKFDERASEFRSVPDTFLMFLSRLQRLSIELCHPDMAPTATRYSKRESEERGLYMTFLTKIDRKGNEESASEQKYYTMKTALHGLPFDEARKDKEGKSIDHATVVLAFPVDEHDEPIIKQQYTYAFLPLRRIGFKFLIQADFVTQANREDVVHSKRNQAVLKGVADAFADAMIVFCKRPSLRYRWMRYLPEDFITDEFWRTLWALIRAKLEQTPLLEPWSGNGLYKPSELEELSESFIDQDRNPLLPDLEGAEVYLSPKYTDTDFQRLKRLGTTTLGLNKFVDRLDADLHRSFGSTWRHVEKNADWRNLICKLLSRAFREHHPGEQKRLRNMALIPLCDGRWVSSASVTTRYFPKTGSIPIPTDLGFDLVFPKAAENIAWAGFLSLLGVMSCPLESVIRSINKRYNAMNLNNFEVSNAVAHIRYLYWFLPKEILSLDSHIRLANQHGSLLRKDQYLYFPDGEDEYSPSKLFQQDAHFPGHSVNYLHGDYLKAVDPDIIHNGRLWVTWLEEMVNVRRIPELCAKGNHGLSKEFQYIISHRSNMLLGTYRRGWACYRHQMNDDVAEELWNSEVLLQSGRRGSLQRTFLPLPKLNQIAAELHIADEYPFIAVTELLRDEDRLDYISVKDLRCGTEEDLDFWLSALDTFKTNNYAHNTASARDQLVRIYQNIQSKCGEDVDHVRKCFKDPLIWIQPQKNTDSIWLSTEHCVWDGPHWLKSKQCLKLDVYFGLEHLFKVSLRIPDASLTDVVNDLLVLKSRGGYKDAFRSQSIFYARPSIQPTEPSFQVFSEPVYMDTTQNFQSITCMAEYRELSFEELRLRDYSKSTGSLSTNTLPPGSKAFAGLETDQIIEEAQKRYEYLWQKHSENLGDRTSLASSFEEHALVYIPTENAWFPPSQCVWVESRVKIPGKVSIADAYRSKKSFFTTILLISEPTVEMYVNSLKFEAAGNGSAAKIKETMALICGLGIGKTDLSSLVESKVLPLKLENGRSGFASASSKNEVRDFAIVDKIAHWNAFKGKITVLDFSLEEIRDTRPLLLALGLEERFSSRLVKEVTEVRGGSQDHDLTRKFRLKSQAIVRCVLHFASPNKRQDVASLYRKFRHAMVHMSDGIRCSLQITQTRSIVEGASSRANFHFEEAEGLLRFYLPKDEIERDVCFESDLPRRLCISLNITDPDAPGIIGAVFRKDNPVVIDRILESAGVGQADRDFAALEGELDISESESDIETLVEAGSNVKPCTPSSRPRPYTPSGWARQGERPFGTVNAMSGHDRIMPQSSYPEQQEIDEETSYKRFLEHVVNVARERVHHGIFETAGTPTQGLVNTKALSEEIIQEAFSAHTLERDFKLGAAGELYMFEYLKGLGLPSFGLENWKSSIRDRVEIHADYHGLEKDYDRSAIADIEYRDDSHKLTRFLSQKGHLTQDFCDSWRPLYHIEVKTTTSPDWRETFFMSAAQERHIREHRIENSKESSNIYLICRIFNLGKGDETGMHIYLDPETRRRNGELEFNILKWAVKPLMHPSVTVGTGSTREPSARTRRRAAARVETNGDDGTTDAGKEAEISSVAVIGSSATDSVGSSLFGSQSATESLRVGQFRLNSKPSGDDVRTLNPPKDSLFRTIKTSPTVRIFSTADSVAPSSDTSKTLSLGLSASLSNAPLTEPSAKGLFGRNDDIAGSKSPRSPFASNPFSMQAVSPGSEASKSASLGKSLFGTARSLPSSSSTTGNLFNPTPSPFHTQSPRPIAGTKFPPVVRLPSSSSTTSGSAMFGTAKPATEVRPLQSSSSLQRPLFSGSGISSTFAREEGGGLDTSISTNTTSATTTQAARHLSHPLRKTPQRSRSPLSDFGFSFTGNVQTGESTTLTGPAFGSSTGITNNANTSKPHPTSADLMKPTRPYFGSPSHHHFEASQWLDKDYFFTHRSRSPANSNVGEEERGKETCDSGTSSGEEGIDGAIFHEPEERRQ